MCVTIHDSRIADMPLRWSLEIFEDTGFYKHVAPTALCVHLRFKNLPSV